MRRTVSLFLLAFVAACAARESAPPARMTPSTTSAASDTAPVPAQKPASPQKPPVIRNGMTSQNLRHVAPAFARYLNRMHDRIHPEFADKELAKLDTLSADDPLNDKRLITRLELVVDPRDGRVVRVDIAKTSGITAFDTAALESIQRAQPFGSAPHEIASADGNVYVDWEFHREDVFACSTMHSRPFLLGP